MMLPLPGESLSRLLRMASPIQGRAAAWLCGLALSLSLALLILLIGLVSELLVERDEQTLSGDAIRWLGPGLLYGLSRSLAPATAVHWLLILLGGTGFASLSTTLMLALQARAAQHAALAVAGALRTKIVRQATLLAGEGNLATRRDPAESLLEEKCDQVESGLLHWWRTVPLAVTILPLLGLVAMLVSLPLTISLAAAVALAVICVRWASERVQAGRDAVAAEVDLAGRRVTEFVRRAAVVRARGQGNLAEDPAPRLTRWQLALGKLRGGELWLQPLLLAMAAAAVCLILLMAGISILRNPEGARPAGDLTVSGLVALGCCVSAAVGPIALLYRLPRFLAPAATSAAEILLYLERTPLAEPSADAVPLTKLQHELKFEHVRLADRDGGLLLDDLTLSIAAGQRVAVISTDEHVPALLAAMLVRRVDPAAGRVLWDGRDLRQAQLAVLRRRAEIVRPDASLLEGTVAEFLGDGGGPFTATELTEKTRQAHVYEIIHAMPQGWATPLSDGSVRLNPAQTLRLGFARALLQEATVVIVHEPDAAWAEAEEKPTDEAMQQLSAERTVIVLATRLETLRRADCVYLIHEGKLVAAGSHFSLLQSSALYRHVNYMRYNEFGTSVR